MIFFILFFTAAHSAGVPGQTPHISVTRPHEVFPHRFPVTFTPGTAGYREMYTSARVHHARTEGIPYLV